MAEVGLLIAFGVLMGAILQQTGAIQRLVEMLLRIFGPKRMPYALSLTIATALQSIFLDVLLVISAPLGRNLAKKIGKNGTARMATAMAIGLECGIVITVPGVGFAGPGRPAGRAAGQDAAVRRLLVIPTVAISVAIMSFLFNHGWWDADRDEQPFLGEEPDFDEPPTDDAATSTGTRPRRRQRRGGGGGHRPTTTRADTSLTCPVRPAAGGADTHRHRRDPGCRRHSQPRDQVLVVAGDRAVDRPHRHQLRRPIRLGRRTDPESHCHRIQGERTDPHPDRRRRLACRHHQGRPGSATSSASTSPPTQRHRCWWSGSSRPSCTSRSDRSPSPPSPQPASSHRRPFDRTGPGAHRARRRRGLTVRGARHQ